MITGALVPETTLKTATELMADPMEFVTTQRNCAPLSVAEVEFKV